MTPLELLKDAWRGHVWARMAPRGVELNFLHGQKPQRRLQRRAEHRLGESAFTRHRQKRHDVKWPVGFSVLPHCPPGLTGVHVIESGLAEHRTTPGFKNAREFSGGQRQIWYVMQHVHSQDAVKGLFRER